MDFLDIVNHAVQQPLITYLGLASEGKAIQADCAADIGEDRFHCAQPFTVKKAPNFRIYFTLHFFGEGVFALLGATMEEGHLPDLGGIRFAETLAPEFAGDTKIRDTPRFLIINMGSVPDCYQ